METGQDLRSINTQSRKMGKTKIYIAFIVSFCVCCESAKQDNEIFKPELKNKERKYKR